MLTARVPVNDPIFRCTSSGSEANELAIKIAREYFRRKGFTKRTIILTRGPYHGSSYGAMTATATPGFRDASHFCQILWKRLRLSRVAVGSV